MKVMTKEDKELLLKDLSARLSYRVVVETRFNLYEGYGKNQHKVGEKIQNGVLTGFGDLDNVIVSFEQYNWESFSPDSIKPYLRPMSSMTDEEQSRYNLLQGLSHLDQHWTVDDGKVYRYADAIDWLNANHFDYRGLIEKGLAIEAPEGMYE